MSRAVAVERLLDFVGEVFYAFLGLFHSILGVAEKFPDYIKWCSWIRWFWWFRETR